MAEFSFIKDESQREREIDTAWSLLFKTLEIEDIAECAQAEVLLKVNVC